MAEKRISVGLAICIVLKVLYGIIGLFIASGAYLSVLQGPKIPLSEKIGLAFFPLCFVVYMVICFFLIRLKNWARWTSIALDTIIILSVLPPLFRDVLRYGIAFFTTEDLWIGLVASVLPLLILLWFIYYLTRPRVKEQFR